MKAHCAFCGLTRKLDAPMNSEEHLRAARAHILECPAHPIRDLLAACRAVKFELLHYMDGAWPGTMSITAKKVGDQINAAIANAEGEVQGPPEEIGTGLYRMADGEVVGGEPDQSHDY